MENEKQPKSFWSKMLDGFLEIFGELIVMLVSVAVGIGIFSLFGRQDLLKQSDPELIALIGILAIFAIVGIVIAVVAVIKKKKK